MYLFERSRKVSVTASARDIISRAIFLEPGKYLSESASMHVRLTLPVSAYGQTVSCGARVSVRRGCDVVGIAWIHVFGTLSEIGRGSARGKP